jgi:dihydrofolate synthase/folylpolyglutamate synthase
MISEDEVAARLTRICSLVSSWDPHPTFFEIATVLALQHFTAEKIDIVVLETGLGGRLDATNAVPSDVAVITPIDFDHQKWLGDTLEKIAGEKAGIIKHKVPVVSAPQLPVVEDVIRARAAECAAPVEFVTQPYEQSPIALYGAHQKQNAAMALAALRAAEVELDPLATMRGLLAVEWPARFQRWDQLTFIDGAHNPMAARALAETWRESFGGQRTTLLLAVLADKDLRGICEALAPITDHVFLPRISSERAADPQDLAKILINLGARCQIGGTVEVALEKARQRAAPILITGSLHFAGEALAYLQGQPAEFEDCLQ